MQATGGGQKIKLNGVGFSFLVREKGEIRIIAELFNSASPPKLMANDVVTYRQAKLGVELRFEDQGSGGFVPFPNYILIGGRTIATAAKFALRVKDDLPPIRNGEVILLTEKLKNGTIIRGPRGVNITRVGNPPRPYWILNIQDLQIPDDVDEFEFRLQVSPQNGGSDIVSDPASYLINRVRIESNTIKVGFTLDYETPLVFSTTLKYSANGPGPYLIEPVVEYVKTEPRS
jgi:hypothetical protein